MAITRKNPLEVKLVIAGVNDLAKRGLLAVAGEPEPRYKYVNGVMTDEVTGYRYSFVSALGDITISSQGSVTGPKQFDFLAKLVPVNLVGGMLDTGAIWLRADDFVEYED